MTSLTKKIKRKRQVEFNKKMKKTIKHFRKTIKCSMCDKAPSPGETIDDWILERKDDVITLTCVECAEAEK